MADVARAPREMEGTESFDARFKENANPPDDAMRLDDPIRWTRWLATGQRRESGTLRVLLLQVLQSQPAHILPPRPLFNELLRKKLGLDHVPGGVSPTKDDNMVIDISDGKSAGGWGHPATTPEATKIVDELPKSHPIAKK